MIVTNGDYGDRMTANLAAHAPDSWTVETWRAPKVMPPVVDEPSDFLPDTLPQADLVVSFGQDPGVVELLVDIVAKTGAKALIAAIDSEEWVPAGLANQVKRALEGKGVASVWPKPMCSLTDTTYNYPKRISYDDPLVAEFAAHFGAPVLEMEASADSIAAVRVVRDASCGCGRHVAAGLVGTRPDDAELSAGMLHHHHPCLATMRIDPELGDTLMHVSGRITKDAVADSVRRFRSPKTTFRPDA